MQHVFHEESIQKVREKKVAADEEFRCLVCKKITQDVSQCQIEPVPVLEVGNGVIDLSDSAGDAGEVEAAVAARRLARMASDAPTEGYAETPVAPPSPAQGTASAA